MKDLLCDFDAELAPEALVRGFIILSPYFENLILYLR